MSPGICNMIEALNDLEKLEANWDSYGAEPINREIITAVDRFIVSIRNDIDIKHVVPTSNGGIQLEWHRGPKTLEFEFETPETIHFLQWCPGEGVEIEDTFPASDLVKARELIEWFRRR